MNCPLPPLRRSLAVDHSMPEYSDKTAVLEVEAGSVSFDRESGQLIGEDTIHLYHRDVEMTAERLRYHQDSRSGELEKAHYQFLQQAGEGVAERIDWSDDEVLTLTNATYSSCLGDHPDWHLRSKRITLNQNENIGRAWHSTFRIGSVPIFYWPYLSFPLSDDRKSGLLLPEFRRDQITGQVISVPLYLNLSPQTDMTLAPTWYQYRGQGMDVEWRFLTQRSSGVLEIDWLPDDRLAEQDRYSARFRQAGQLSSDVVFRVDLNAVSDNRFFEDFGESLVDSSQPRVYSVAEISYLQPDWQVRLLAENEVQLSAAGKEVYSRQPELRLHSERSLGYGFEREIDTTLAHFVHPNDSAFPATTRFDFNYQLAWRYSGRYGYIQPEANARLTRYESSVRGSGDRFLPSYSVDSGLFFQRAFGDSDAPYWHTFEPRLTYTHIPYQDQSKLPLLDTERVTFDSSGLLQSNRFLGADRIGDTRQIAVMLGQRIIGSTHHRSLGRLNLGKIYYLQNRKVQLKNTDPVEKVSFSGTLAELEWTPNSQWRTVLEGLTEGNTKTLERARLAFWYQPGPNRLINVSRSYSRAVAGGEDEVDDLSIAVAYPFRAHLAGYVKASYSFLHDEMRETFLGLEYQTCCWSVRTQWSRFIPNVADLQTIRNTFSINFEFRGIGETNKKGIANWIENDTLDLYR